MKLEKERIEKALMINECEYEYEDMLLAFCINEALNNDFHDDNRKYYSRKVRDRSKTILRYYSYLYDDPNNDPDLYSHIYERVRDYQKLKNGVDIEYFIVYELYNGKKRIIRRPGDARDYSEDLSVSIRKKYGYTCSEIISGGFKARKCERNI